MKNSIQTLRELSRRPSGNSAVSLRELSRDLTGTEPWHPTGTEPWVPYGNSAVGSRLSSRLSTDIQQGFNLSAPIQPFRSDLQVDFDEHRYAASSAPAARALAQQSVVTVKDKDKTSKGLKL